MALELNIKPEDIDRLVKDSIMQAGFGKAVQEAVTKAVSGYNNPIDEAIKRYVGQVASELIREKYDADVRTAVSRIIAERVTQDLIDKTVDAVVQKMERAAEGY